MHWVLLTLLAAPTAGPGSYDLGAEVPGAAACDDCGQVGQHGHWHARRPHVWLGPMPQSCYNPTLGCYAGSRMMHRYPAFHGTYYRRAYNYRNYFDYPWHAGLHEPTSLFSYGSHLPPAGQPLGPPLPLPHHPASPDPLQGP